MHEGRVMRPDEAGAAKNLKPVAPSPIKFKFGVIPHELTVAEIKHMENQFVEAARRVKDAGYDCVEIHGATAISSALLCPLIPIAGPTNTAAVSKIARALPVKLSGVLKIGAVKTSRFSLK